MGSAPLAVEAASVLTRGRAPRSFDFEIPLPGRNSTEAVAVRSARRGSGARTSDGGVTSVSQIRRPMFCQGELHRMS